ncbi:hypothetical protein MTO96_003474 [Rhipicephalus appendiculatus]
MAFRAPPPKAHRFCFNASTDSTADEIIDAIEEVTGPRGLKSLQHQGGTKFCIAVATATAAAKLSTRASFVLNGAAVPVAQKPSTSPKAAAQEGDTRADDTASRDNVEEAQVGKSDNPQEEAPIKDWSTWADDSSLSLPATKDSTSLTDTESLSGASQVASTTSDDTRQSTSSSENAPPPNTPSGADPKHSKPRGVKHTSGQVAAGRGHRSHAGESPNWKAATEPPNTPQDQQPLSPISRVLKQSRDPSLRNPLNQIIGVLGQDCDMQVDKPDLKRPHHSSSSTDELGNPRKQAATETSRTEGPPGSKPPRHVTDFG